MLYRVTRWVDSRGALQQLGLAFLDDTWECLAEVWTPAGPFDVEDDLVHRLVISLAAVLSERGIHLPPDPPVHPPPDASPLV